MIAAEGVASFPALSLTKPRKASCIASHLPVFRRGQRPGRGHPTAATQGRAVHIAFHLLYLLERYKPIIDDGKTVVVYGPENNDLVLQLRKRGISKVILVGSRRRLKLES